jgi:probable HAF family extracellular repeat protein
MRQFALIFLFLTTAFGIAFAGDRQANQPQWIPIQVSGEHETFLLGINNSGVVVGEYNSPGAHGLVVVGKNQITLDVPGGSNTYCFGINSAGAIVGSYSKQGFTNRGFIFQNGQFSDLDPHTTSAASINDSGWIVGTYFQGHSNALGFLFDGTTYKIITVPGAVTTQATGINNQGLITVQWADSESVHSSLYDGSTFTNIDVPGAKDTWAYGINNAGDVVFSWDDAQHNLFGAVLHNGRYYKFLVPGTNQTEAFAINDGGVVVGTSWNLSQDNIAGFKRIP